MLISNRFIEKSYLCDFLLIFNPNSRYIQTGTLPNENKSNDAAAKWIYISKIQVKKEKKAAIHADLKSNGGDSLHEILSNENSR